MGFFEAIIAGMPLLQWGVYLLLSAGIFFLLRMAIHLTANRMGRQVNRTPTEVDNFLVRLMRRIRGLFLAGMALWGTSHFFPIEAGIQSAINLGAMLLVLFQVGVSASVVIEFLLRQRMDPSENQARQETIRLMAKIISWFVWAVLVVMAVDSIPGFDANTLITTLGIGGIAVAFALQNVLSDVASALTIAFDQPFEVGDGIQVGEVGGTVENIGLKSTRVRAYDGQQVIFANSDLLKSRINNYQSLQRRRVMLNLGVVCETPLATLEKIPAIVKDVVDSTADAEYAWCYFTELGASAHQFQAMYWVTSADYNVFLQARHTVLMAVLHRFEDEGIDLAYPTQTVLLGGTAPGQGESETSG